MRAAGRFILLLVVGTGLVAACQGGARSPAANASPPAITSYHDATPTVGLARRPVSAQATAPRCPDPSPPLVTDQDVRQAPSLPEPVARAPFRDPVFGTCMVRVTDRARDLSPGDESRGLKNEYSRVQAFNADESLILVRGLAATWYIYDAITLQPLGMTAFSGAVDPRWDPADPARLYFSDETRLMAYNVWTGQQRLVHEFAADFPGESLSAVWMRYEGSPTLDGRYWGLMAVDDDWNAVAFLVYDRSSDKVVAQRDVRGLPGIDEGVDYVTISPLGTYFVAGFNHYCARGVSGTDARPCGLMIYDRNLADGRGPVRMVGHHDMVLDADGREVVVYQDADTDDIALLDLATGRVTALWPIDFSHTAIGLHISGQAVRRPGWALVSTHDADTASSTWMDDQVFAIELRPHGRVARLAHTRSLVDPEMEHDYWAEPQATTNRDFTRILFTSNWGRSGSEEVEMYLVELAPGWPDSLP